MSPENEVPSEDALFDNAVDETQSPAPPEPAPAPPPAPPVEQPPPERPKPDVIEVKPEGTPPEGETEMVPISRIRGIDKEKRAAEAERDALRRERDRIDFERQEYARQLAAMRQPQPDAPKPSAPDPLLDPDGYRNYMESRFEERLANERREFSLQSARKTYREEFDQAYEAARQLVDPALRARMQQSADPGETLMGWFRDLKFRHEVGPDPAAYKKRLRDEALDDPEFRKTAMERWQRQASAVGASGRPNISLAPSLNGVSRSNAALRASQQDLPDDDLWDATTTT